MTEKKLYRQYKHKQYFLENYHKQHYNQEKQRRYQSHQAHTSSKRDRSQERYSKCGYSQHFEGFSYPTSKHQCKICHRFGHFSSLCYKKREKFQHNQRSLESRLSQTHQLQPGQVYLQDSICDQSEDLLSSEDSFCVQLQLKSTQGETKLPAPQHLITNLANKLHYHMKTQYLRARIDTCADVNILPVSVYKLTYDDPDCKKLAPSRKEIGTYTTDKIKIIGSCELLVVPPDTNCLKEISFQVTCHEGSVVLSCETSLRLSLIQPCRNLDQIRDSASLICSNADHPMKRKSKKSVHVSEQSKSVFTRKEQVPTKSVLQEKYVNQCVIQEVQEETSKQECPVRVIDHSCNDKNCQMFVCGDDTNSQSTQCIQPVKPGNTVWSIEPATQSRYKKLCSDKNCKSTRCYKKMNQGCGHDQNCQST